MSDWQEGDLVEAVLGETRIVARLELWEDGNLYFKGWGPGVDSADYDGYTLTLVERAVPKVDLPTNDGAIITWNKGFAQETAVLEATNQWLFNGENFETAEIEQFIAGHPVTRLEPVADTARRVLDEVRMVALTHAGNPWNANVTLKEVAAIFGVTNVV